MLKISSAIVVLALLAWWQGVGVVIAAIALAGIYLGWRIRKVFKWKLS